MQGFVDARVPVKSNMSFVSPDSIVKPSPSIRNLVKDQPVTQLPPAAPAAPVQPQSQPEAQPQDQPTTAQQPPIQPAAQPAPQTPAAPQQQPSVATQPTDSQQQPMPAMPQPMPVPSTPQPQQPVVTPQPQQPEVQPVQPPVTQLTPQPTTPQPQPQGTTVMPSFPVGSEKYNEAFLACWNEMIDIVFEDVQTLKIPLHNYPVEVSENVARVILRNDFQMDDFSMKKNVVLQYIRSHFDERINDVIPEMDTVSEAKKYILDEKDKLEVLRQENPDIVDFMQTLNLRLKN